ncbi:MAG: hypothetical protein OEW87_12310 [Flavobacteriaceae bacterium]|nr:hypothetical protein [Flavobacteriaceae bacterium]
MKKDTLKKINTDFINPEEAISILSEMELKNDEPVPERIYRAIIFLSEGNIEKLHHFIELYFIDYRDLIWQAEYEDPEVQKYDFNKSFNELGLL